MDVGRALSVVSAAVALATLGVKEIASRRRRRTLTAQIKKNDENAELDRGAKASANIEAQTEEARDQSKYANTAFKFTFAATLLAVIGGSMPSTTTDPLLEQLEDRFSKFSVTTDRRLKALEGGPGGPPGGGGGGAAAIAELKDAFSDLRSQVTVLEENVLKASKIPAAVDQLLATVEALQARVEALERRVESSDSGLLAPGKTFEAGG